MQIEWSRISIRDLFALLLNYWVNRPLNIDTNLENEMQNLGTVIHSLVQNVGVELLVVDYNCTSPFWTEVRNIIVGSSKPFPALMAAILSKSVANLVETENELEKSIEEEYEVWEKLSQEKCEWSLLIGKKVYNILAKVISVIISNKPRVIFLNRNKIDWSNLMKTRRMLLV